jgi:hypothetical protein
MKGKTAMSELSIAELDSQSVELLPQRETLGVIIINSTSIAIAHDAREANAINNTLVPIINSFNTDIHTHVNFFPFPMGG